MADLYLCQNELWNYPAQLLSDIRSNINLKDISNINWTFQSTNSNGIRVFGEFEDCFILIQVFPENKFLTIDIFWWQPHLAVEHFGEFLVELFRPQVVATESRLRAEHLN
jgi:S-adenosylmethionine/arginine decarboxylase-like enzyme